MADHDSGVGVVRASFGAYDVLGYFIPGASLLGCITVFEWLALSTPCTGECAPKTPVYSTIAPLLALQSTSPWYLQVLAISALLLAAYVAGHIAASVSAVFVDRIYVARGHGYPLQYHLGTDEPNDDEVSSRHFHRAMMFWLNLYLIVRFLALPGVLPIQDLAPRVLGDVLPEIASRANLRLAASLLSYLILVSLTTRALHKLATAGRPEWYKILCATDRGKAFLRGTHFALEALSAPSRGITAIIGGATRTTRVIDSGTREMFIQRLTLLVGDPGVASTSSAYWYAFIHLRRSDPVSTPLLENWLRLYSFARNLSTALYIAAIYAILWWHSQSAALPFTPDVAVASIQTIPLVLLAASFLLLQRYYFLYADYYTKYLIRAFALDRGKSFTPGS